MSGSRERRQQVGEAWTTWLITRGQWRLVAACRSADPDLFFPISDSGRALEQAVEAKAICATCRVRRECLAFALRTEQVHGIWGGTTEHERTAVRRDVGVGGFRLGVHQSGLQHVFRRILPQRDEKFSSVWPVRHRQHVHREEGTNH